MTSAAPHETEPDAPASTALRLDVLKALGDNTRYAIYLELARSSRPRATAEIADELGLHVNTVRPHLERMRDVGLLDLAADPSGGVGRPQHRYFIAADAPALGLEPPLFPTLASMLLQVAAEAGADGADATAAGCAQGRADAHSHGDKPCPEALIAELDKLGFDPQVVTTDDTITVGFGHCPFQALAETNPSLVCGLHQGMVEGFVDELAGCDVADFRNLAHRNPCQVDLVLSSGSSQIRESV